MSDTPFLTSFIAFSLFVFFAAAISLATPSPTTQPADYRVVSYNIRYANPGDGKSAWPKRKPLFVKSVDDLRPDLLGLQEALIEQVRDVQTAMGKDFGSVFAGREDGKSKGESCAIFYRKSRFELLKEGTFWLSEHPDQVGSKGWDAALPRICEWVILRDRDSSKEILYANCHLDHMGRKSRAHSAELLKKKLPELSDGRPVILTGDFNSRESSPGYHTLTSQPGGWIDSYRDKHPRQAPDEATFHDFTGKPAGERIDFIFHSATLPTRDAGIDRSHNADGLCPSDHFAVWAVIASPAATP